MIEAYRLHSSRYPATDGKGAALHGGRWNPRGTQVIYAATSRSLAVLEILVHYSVLPRDFVITPISIPARLLIAEVPDTVLTPGWDGPIPILATREYGKTWIGSNSSAVLRVPSAIVPGETNYLLNVLHPAFVEIGFGPSEPFAFDSRLRKENFGR